MTLQRRLQIGLGLAIVLAGLIPDGTNVARGAALMRFISSDFCGAVVIHPERIRKSTLAAALKTGLPKGMASANASSAAVAALANQKNLPPGMDVAKLAKLIEGKTVIRVVILLDPLPAADLPAAPGIIVQFGDDIDGEAILAALSSEWQPAETEGTKYKKMKNPEAGKPDLAAFVPDARTLVAGLDSTVVKMLAKDQGAQPLLKQLQHTSLDNDIVVEFLAAGTSADKVLAKVGGADAAKIAKDVKSVSVKLNFSGETLLHAEVATDTPETAEMFAAIARKSIADTKPKFEETKKQPPLFVPPPAVAVISKLGDEIFAGLTVKNDGPRLVIDLPMPASLPDALKFVAQLGAQMAPLAGPPPAGPGNQGKR